MIDPDEQVQAVVRLIFDQFDCQGTMHGMIRYLVRHRVRIPVRFVGGPNKGQLEWRPPKRATLQKLLRHPVYAGAYRYGHRPSDPRRKTPGRPYSGARIRRPEECEVLLRDRLPAYITWERFEANQQRLRANQALAGTPGAPREGSSVLRGLVRCGRCGRRMLVQYRWRNRPAYLCTRGVTDGEAVCQRLSNGAVLDGWVAGQLLAAVEPAALEASLAAVAGAERERADLDRQWELRRERAAYETDRAARQYHACEPENRLVARELERRWEEALKAQRQLGDEYERWEWSAPAELSDTALSAIRALAADLPAVWAAPTTTPADRQRIARLLLERVVVTVVNASERVDVALHWAGGAVQSHVLTREVVRYDQLSGYPRLVARLRELREQKRTATDIARQLNAGGFRPPKQATRFTRGIVRALVVQLGLGYRPHGSTEGLGPDECRPRALARRLGVSLDTVRRWTDVGWVHARRDEDGHRVIWADADELRRLGELRRSPQTLENKGRLAELRKPKPRPAR